MTTSRKAPHGAASQLLRARDMPDFRFENARVDVRGWRVYASDAVLAGSVESLLVEMRTRAVRYLGVALVDPETKMPTGTVLVPVGAAARPVDGHVVVLTTIPSTSLAAVPRLRPRPVTRSDEDAALTVYGLSTRDLPSGGFYARPAFLEDCLFGCPNENSAETGPRD